MSKWRMRFQSKVVLDDACAGALTCHLPERGPALEFACDFVRRRRAEVWLSRALMCRDHDRVRLESVERTVVVDDVLPVLAEVTFVDRKVDICAKGRDTEHGYKLSRRVCPRDRCANFPARRRALQFGELVKHGRRGHPGRECVRRIDQSAKPQESQIGLLRLVVAISQLQAEFRLRHLPMSRGL